MINWKSVIADLESWGWTRHGLAEHCGLRYSTLCDLANGRSNEPRGNAAVRLNDLHRAKQQPAATAPLPVSDQQQAA